MLTRALTAMLASGALLVLTACGTGTGTGDSGGNGHGGNGGNGSAGAPAIPSAGSLAHDAMVALSTAGSVKFKGSITEKGQVIKVDLAFTHSGAVSGSISGPIAGMHLAVNVIVAGGAAYFLIDRQYFNNVLRQHGVPANACATYCGKYIKETAKPLQDLRLSKLTARLFASSTVFSGAVTTSTIDGQPVYRIHDNKGEYLYVSRAEPHRPVEVTKPGTGTVIFSDWNSVPPISAPPRSKVFDPSSRTPTGA